MKRVGLFFLALVIVFAGAYGYRWYLVSELRKPVLAELNDPDSAKFRNERLLSPWTVSNSILCGEMNTRNGMGGYVGFSPFYVDTLGERPIVEVGNETAKSWCEIEEDDSAWWWLRW